MRTFNAINVVLFAALAGTSASGWAKGATQQGGPPSSVLVAQAQTGLQPGVLNDFGGMQPVVFYPRSAPGALSPATQTVAAATVQSSAPGQEQEDANMGMMILVGLGMMGTVMVKSRRS